LADLRSTLESTPIKAADTESAIWYMCSEEIQINR